MGMGSVDSLMKAWLENEKALKNWLITKTGTLGDAEDILQDVFVKALQKKERFYTLDNASSWLFKMAKNNLIDQHRKTLLEIGSVAEQSVEEDQSVAVVNLQHCLRKVLPELGDQDKHIIEACDMNGLTQADYALQNSLSLSAAKSRIQRARKKLRVQLIESCDVKFDEKGVCCSKAEK